MTQYASGRSKVHGGTRAHHGHAQIAERAARSDGPDGLAAWGDTRDRSPGPGPEAPQMTRDGAEPTVHRPCNPDEGSKLADG